MILISFTVFYFIYYFNIRPIKIVKSLTESDNFSEKNENNSVYVIIAGSVAFAVLILRVFFFELVTIPSASMMPNYVVGQKLLIDKMTFGIRSPLDNMPLTISREPVRGEVVITQFPLNPQVMFIKRIVGLPGDRISLSEEHLIINDQEYPLERLDDRKYVVNEEEGIYKIYAIKLGDFAWELMVSLEKEFPKIDPMTMPNNGYFLLGDNLTGSSDSRFFGPIPMSYFIASIN